MLPSRVWRTCAQVLSRLGSNEASGKLGDFTATWRVIFLSFLVLRFRNNAQVAREVL